MDTNYFSFEVEGQRALGFDTGLSPLAFARLRQINQLTERGYIVTPSAIVSPWTASGTVERNGTMVIWGPDFRGERLDRLIQGDQSRALEALRWWVKGRKALRSQSIPLPPPYPGSAFVSDEGTLFFPPPAMALRSLSAEGPQAQLEGVDRWVHPDKKGEEADVFTLAALLYRVFTGTAPFAGSTDEECRENIRDGKYTPIALAVPQLRGELRDLIDRTLEALPQKNGRDEKSSVRPRLDDFMGALANPDVYVSLDPTVLEKTQHQRQSYEKKHEKNIARKRYLRKNRTVLTIAAITLGALVLVAQSIIRDQASRPTTAGMTPLQVVQTYYGSFNTLDHQKMSACVRGKAGSMDIEAVMNLYVISKVRQAYERKNSVLSPEDWKAQGSPVTDATIFGITDLTIQAETSPKPETEALFTVKYRLWHPADTQATAEPSASPSASPPPVAETRVDRLQLKRDNHLWHIVLIDRRVESN